MQKFYQWLIASQLAALTHCIGNHKINNIMQELVNFIIIDTRISLYPRDSKLMVSFHQFEKI